MAKKVAFPDVITKAFIVDHLAAELGTKKAESERFVNAFLDLFKAALKKKKEIRLVGFGTFKVDRRKARKIKDPRDPSKILRVKAKNVVKFK
ncbi:MAG TPA: hypothetical protein ENF73_01945, partial [Proteobacteria bacterium]|nr:hypothetical protein [Pseudomonadota bacterium]